MIQFDFFPATVHVADVKLPLARVSIDGEMRGVVLIDKGRSGGVETFAHAQIESVERDPDRGRRSWIITTTEGERWLCRLGGGCGCGNPLKRFDSEPAIHEAFA